jgi:hypothetical protein
VSEFRKEFIQALELLARAFERVVQAGYPRPILVGGAAVEAGPWFQVTSIS